MGGDALLLSSSVSRQLCLRCGNNEDKKCIHHDSSEIRGANLSSDLHLTLAHELMMMALKCQETVRTWNHFRYHRMAHLTQATRFIAQDVH